MTERVTVELKPENPRRVLLVEDNYIIGLGIANQIRESGFEPVGPIPSLREGLEMARRDGWAGAILDINIRGGSSELIARELEGRGVPFFFVTGYASPMLISDQMRSHFRLSKPVTNEALRSALQRQFGT